MLNSPPPGGAPAAVNRQLPQDLSASGSQQQGIGQGTSYGNVPGGLSGYSGIYSGQPAPAGPPPNANANGIAGFGQTPIPNISGMLTTPPPASPQGFGSPFPGGQGYSDYSGTGAPGSPFAGGQGYSNMAPGQNMASPGGGQGNPFPGSLGNPFPGGQGYSMAGNANPSTSNPKPHNAMGL